ncbi:hypothetical protein HZA85_03115 [Candidatus Uhrbacteria bacterium]|nr:hypothetical protein [Candidatus Uhrbacteria bacterium]
MSETDDLGGVYHITDREIRDRELTGTIRPTDRVVIPAKHEGATIQRTLEYLLRLGFHPRQIIVLVNGSTAVDGEPDDTADKAMTVDSDLQVLHQSDLLDAALVARLTCDYKINENRLHGKGTAMFAALVALHRAGTSLDARIIFLDADIQNSFEVDPVGRLLIGADFFPHEVKLVKLASLGRDNAGIHAFLSTLVGDYMKIGALRWPLCGQVVVRWEDLRQMRLAGGYAVEMAMMMDLVERAHSPVVFGEVEIGAVLIDKHNTDRVHTRMYAQIMWFAGQVQMMGYGLGRLTSNLMAHINAQDPFQIWVPVKESGLGSNELEDRYPDAIFPSIAELF